MRYIGAGVTIVVDIDLGNEPSLTTGHLIALLESTKQRNLFAKRCHFTHKGKKYMLFVPAKLNNIIPKLDHKLYDEPYQQAGPMRLAELFVGISVLQKTHQRVLAN